MDYTHLGIAGISSYVRKGIFVVWIFLPVVINGQLGLVNTCSTEFTDSGGAGGNYGSNEDRITTFCPDAMNSGGRIRAIFTSFNVDGSDDLSVYDGNSIAAPLIDVYSGDAGNMRSLFIASNECLTFRFESNGNSEQSGWIADIYCEAPQDRISEVEICDDGVDNDGDQFIDEFDLSCIMDDAVQDFDCDNALTYFIPPVWRMAPAGNTNYNEPSSLNISTIFPSANIYISTEDGSYTFSGTVTNSNSLTIDLQGENVMQTPENNVVENDMGLIVSSDFPIQLIYKVDANNNKVLMTGKGMEALGRSFIAGSQTRMAIARTQDANLSENHFVSVMAVEDDTEVRFTFDIPMAGITSPHDVTLDKGETFLIKDDENNTTVTGIRITSDKDIAAVSGSQHSRLLDGRDLDGGIDQLVPIDKLGNDYVVVRGGVTADDDYAIITAVENNTSIFIDGSGTPEVILDAGEFYEYYLGGSVAGTPHYVSSSKPIYLYHVTGLLSEEVGMGIAAPISECTGSTMISFAEFSAGQNVVQIIIADTGLPSLEFNGDLIADIGGATSFPVPGLLPPHTAVTIPNSAVDAENTINAMENFTAGLIVGDNASGTF